MPTTTPRKSRSKAAAIPPAPPPTPEQQAAYEAAKRDAERLIVKVEDMTAAIAAAANRLAPEHGGRVTRLAHTGGGATTVMFGNAGPYASLCMSGPGLAECEIEVDWMSATPGKEAPRIRTRFQSYSTSGNTTPEQAEVQGLALVAAARFSRAVVAAVSGERTVCGGTREFETLGGMLIHRDGWYRWRCTKCGQEGESTFIQRECDCKSVDGKVKV